MRLAQLWCSSQSPRGAVNLLGPQHQGRWWWEPGLEGPLGVVSVLSQPGLAWEGGPAPS